MLGLTAVVSTHAQGRLNLDTYNTAPFPMITYGPANANGGSCGVVGDGVVNFNIGIYWIAGTSTIANDPSGYGLPSVFAPAYALRAGRGATTVTGTGSTAGYFQTVNDFTMTPLASGLATAFIVAYNGASYDTSTVRGHSAAFTFTPQQTGAAPGA